MNIANIRDCYGCGVCATACGRKIIEIGLNADGFYEPHISMLANVLIVVFVLRFVPISMMNCL